MKDLGLLSMGSILIFTAAIIAFPSSEVSAYESNFGVYVDQHIIQDLEEESYVFVNINLRDTDATRNNYHGDAYVESLKDRSKRLRPKLESVTALLSKNEFDLKGYTVFNDGFYGYASKSAILKLLQMSETFPNVKD